MKLKCPLLVNFDQNLIVDGVRFFKIFKIKHLADDNISFPVSIKGTNASLNWMLTRDAELYEFVLSKVVNAWALPFNKIVGIPKIKGKLINRGRVKKRDINNLFEKLKPDNPDFNNRKDFEEIIIDKADDDYITEDDMQKFLCISEDYPVEYWPK